MNLLFIVLAAGLFFLFGFLVYARAIERVFGVDASCPTPAVSKGDGVDFVPARNWFVLFGHHFSSIAGAAPIIGPVIAVSIWGWFPAFAWIVLGSVFIGGVHDFSSLIISVKSGGRSIAHIANDVISSRARLIFSLFIFLTLILIIAVFAFLCAQTLVTDARVVMPSLGLIPIAMVVGFLLYRLRSNQVLATILGLAGAAFLIVWGGQVSSVFGRVSLETWIVILLVYAFFASCLPVQILLQPRDYLSAYLLFIGIVAGYAGIFIVRPAVDVAFFVPSSVADNPLWPMLFVTVACGAVSGFHALIASGTTSKQISTEGHAKRIGYGAMILEGMLAILALGCVASGLGGQKHLVALLKDAGPVAVFSKGFGIMTFPLLGQFGVLIGVVILNAFILTTLDTATRIARYIFEEITGLRNRWAATCIVVVCSGYLAFGGRWSSIWPAFGASNQLVATLALFVITTWLLSRKKPFSFVLLPGIAMLATTIGAFGFQMVKYMREQQMFLFLISAVLIVLALYMLAEVSYVFYKKFKATKVQRL